MDKVLLNKAVKF